MIVLVIWILASTHQIRALPCASEVLDGHELGNIWDYCVYLLLLAGPLQLLVGGIVVFGGAASGNFSLRLIAISHMVSALVQARLLSPFCFFELKVLTRNRHEPGLLRHVGNSIVGCDGRRLFRRHRPRPKFLAARPPLQGAPTLSSPRASTLDPAGPLVWSGT